MLTHKAEVTKSPKLTKKTNYLSKLTKFSDLDITPCSLVSCRHGEQNFKVTLFGFLECPSVLSV